MTMHLIGPELSTTSTHKRKKKLSDSQYHKMCVEWAAYNKQMKKIGSKTKTINEYIAYRQGRIKTPLKSSPKDIMTSKLYVRESPKIPSLGDQIGIIPAKAEQKYTGTLIKGIAVTHKSNLVPVMNQEQAEDIARMRRG